MITKFSSGTPFNTEAVITSFNAGDVKPIEDLCSDINGTSNAMTKEKVTVTTKDSKFSFHHTMDKDTVIYGLGQSMGGINKRGRIYSSYCTDDPSHTENKESLYGAHNFIIIHHPWDMESDTGYFFDYPGKLTFDIGFTNINDMEIYCDTADIAVYKIDYEKEHSYENENPLTNIVRQFRTIIGQSYIPPRWAFGFMQSRWGYKTEQDIREVYDSYKKTGIPLDSICMDIDYMEDFKDFTIDKNKFSDLKGLSDELKKDGVRLVPIIDAGVKIQEGYDVYEEGVKHNYFCKKADGKDFTGGVWPGRTHFPDFLQPEVRKWFGQKYKVLTDLGIEGFWNDMNEPAIFYSDEGLEEVLDKIRKIDTANLDIYSFFDFKDLPGKLSNSQDDYNRFYHKVKQNGETKYIKHNDIHNMYGYNMTRSAGEELAEIRKGQRTLLFSRSSYIGMHRYGGIWTGDNCSWWEHLALEIRMMPGLNMCGFLYSGADIGGFGCNTSRELLLRWLAFGVFTPLMRNHAALGTRNQECYQFENTEDFKSVISVRYQLLPYIYSEYIKAAVNNTMYFRPLSFDYPSDTRCLEIDDQLMVGNDIMAAPVYKPNAKGRMVYLPEDMIEIRFNPDNSVTQKLVIKGDHYIEVPLNEVVMFIKKGHCIPLAQPALNTDSINYEKLNMAGDLTKPTSYELYTDDGYTADINIKENIITITNNNK